MHYYVRLEEGSPPKDYWATWEEPKFNPTRMLEEYVTDQRKKTIPFA